MTKVRHTLLLLPLLMLTPGCIVKEIRDGIYNTNDSLAIVQQQLNELRATNQKLDRLQQQLTELDTRLAGVDQRLKEVNGNLTGVNDRLTAVDGQLETVDEKLKRLTVLDAIEASLKRLDVHLASLRVTISKISDTIPFFDFSGGDDAATTQPGGFGGAEVAPGAPAPTTRPRVRIRPQTQPTTLPASPVPGGGENK